MSMVVVVRKTRLSFAGGKEGWRRKESQVHQTGCLPHTP